MPLRWNELDAPTVPAFHVSDFAEWRKRLDHDPWADMQRSRQRLSLTEA
jgi:bifunctional non-homologous end joining protein LigD